MKTNKFWSIIMMLVLILGTVITISSCGDDDDDDNTINGTGNTSNSSDYDEYGWTRNASMLRSIPAYYVGAWYNQMELSTYRIALMQGDTQTLRTAISRALIFNQNGTGEELSYYRGSSGSNTFRWKVTKTKRPNEDTDYLVIEFDNGYTMNVAIYNSSGSNDNGADRSIGYTLIDKGDNYFEEYPQWTTLTRIKGGRLF